MTTYHVKKISLIESRQNSTPAASLNTTDMSFHNTNLESYKKALHNIVRRLNKTPSSTNKTQNRKSESKINQTHVSMFTSPNNITANSYKKHFLGSAGSNKTNVTPKRSLSNENSHYKTSKDLLNKSLHDPHIRKDSLYTSISKSISTNKHERHQSQDIENHDPEKPKELVKNESKYTIEEPSMMTSYALNEVTNNSPMNKDNEKRLRELVSKYQMRDSAYRQEILKLKKANEAMKTHAEKLEKEVERLNKNKEIEKKYTAKLEAELNHMKTKLNNLQFDKKSASTASSDKENRYMKTIEDLKEQVTNISSEKKMVESMLKNALQNHDMNRENPKLEKHYSNHTLNGLETSFGGNSSKYSNIPRSRMKTDNFAKKTMDTDMFNDENEYPMQAQYPPQNLAFGGMPNKLDRSGMTLKDSKEASFNIDIMNLNKFLNEGMSIMDSTCSNDEDEEMIFPDKVANPKLLNKSLKERMDLNKFKLDFTRIARPRKIE